jgi:ribose transport system ATP-binding protein
VRPLQLSKPVSAYSGGNQQKVLIAKALARKTRVFIFDEPTVGIDVSARVEVYGFMKALAESGAAILMISSDLPEVMNMSHRLYVVKDGAVVDHMDKSEISEGRILASFFSHAVNEAA